MIVVGSVGVFVLLKKTGSTFTSSCLQAIRVARFMNYMRNLFQRHNIDESPDRDDRHPAQAPRPNNSSAEVGYRRREAAVDLHPHGARPRDSIHKSEPKIKPARLYPSVPSSSRSTLEAWRQPPPTYSSDDEVRIHTLV